MTTETQEETMGAEPQVRIFVNEARTVLVNVWPSGTVTVARREDSGHTWGPPIYLKEEK